MLGLAGAGVHNQPSESDNSVWVFSRPATNRKHFPRPVDDVMLTIKNDKFHFVSRPYFYISILHNLMFFG